jgi:ubiquinol-cytochrome c reductase cytochrome b subunit
MANPMSTPAHIVPEWYFLPFYAILRSVPDKIGGVIAMFAAIAILMFLPTLNISKFRIAKFKPLYQFAYFLFVMCFLGLGYIGSQPAEAPYTGVGENLTIFYFLFFIVIIPVLGLIENRYVKLHPNSEPLFPTNTYDKYRN